MTQCSFLEQMVGISYPSETRVMEDNNPLRSYLELAFQKCVLGHVSSYKQIKGGMPC